MSIATETFSAASSYSFQKAREIVDGNVCVYVCDVRNWLWKKLTRRMGVEQARD